jgi:hypothetical protein
MRHMRPSHQTKSSHTENGCILGLYSEHATEADEANKFDTIIRC